MNLLGGILSLLVDISVEVSSMFEFDFTVLPRHAQTYVIKGKGVSIIFRAAKGNHRNRMYSCWFKSSQLLLLLQPISPVGLQGIVE